MPDIDERNCGRETCSIPITIYVLQAVDPIILLSLDHIAATMQPPASPSPPPYFPRPNPRSMSLTAPCAQSSVPTLDPRPLCPLDLLDAYPREWCAYVSFRHLGCSSSPVNTSYRILPTVLDLEIPYCSDGDRRDRA